MARRRNDTDAGMGCLLFMGLFVLGLIITYWYVAIPVAAIIGAVMAYRPLAVYFQREEDRNAVEAATRKTEARRQAASQDRWIAEITAANPMADEQALRQEKHS